MDNISEVDFHITNKCNLRCIYCCYDSGRTKIKELCTNDALYVLKKIVAAGVSELHFTGGEPLLREDICYLIKKAVDFNLNVRLQTNGFLISKDVAQKLWSAGLRKIMISLDGPRDIHNFLRNNSESYNKAINAIKICKKTGFETRLNTVVNSYNLDKLADILHLGLNLGVDIHSFFYMTPMGSAKGKLDLWVKPNDYFNACNEFEKYINMMDLKPSRKYKILIEGAYALKDGSNFTPSTFCRVKSKKGGCCLVLANGEVFPCVLFLEIPNSSLGNILKENLEDIWEKRWKSPYIYRSVRDYNCERCSFFDKCLGGCPPYAYLWEKRIDIRDPRCKYAKNIVPICPAVKTKEWIIGGRNDKK